MGFNLRVMLHVAGLFLTVSVLSWCLFNTSYYATMFTLTLVLTWQIAALLRFVSSTNRELSRFLAAVKYADFSQSFRRQAGHASFRELGEAFDAVIERLRGERGEKEAQTAYLQAFVQQLPIAVLALQEDGRIAVANQAFRRFCGHDWHHLDQLRNADPALAALLEGLRPAQDQSVRLMRGQSSLHLLVSCTLLRQRGQQHKLVSILDISSELETRELEAWQNLIRVMTHEIMNSITPITSLADTARQYVSEASEQLRDEPEIRTLLDDAASATTTIGKRGQGLMRFVQSYRTLSKLPTPKLVKFRVRELLQSVAELMQEQAALLGCPLLLECQPENLELHADPELLEQALINLVRNALEASEAGLDVRIRGELRDLGEVALIVKDRGCGIDAENLENIFVPFFTTKRGGNGIGMTIVRQIVTLNGGAIRVNSRPGEGTEVVLVF